jgi:hypothetical protein
MKRILVSTAAILALSLSAISAFGDDVLPKSDPTSKERAIGYSRLTIVADNKAWDATLQISEGTLKRIQEGAANRGEGASLTQSIMHSSPRTIMAGLFMFLAISFAGVWLARSQKRQSARAIAAVLVIVFAFTFAAMMVRANAGPTGYTYWRNLPQSLENGRETSGDVNITVVPGDGKMKLLLPLRRASE